MDKLRILKRCEVSSIYMLSDKLHIRGMFMMPVLSVNTDRILESIMFNVLLESICPSFLPIFYLGLCRSSPCIYRAITGFECGNGIGTEMERSRNCK